MRIRAVLGLWLLGLAVSAWAGKISPERISAGGSVVRDLQLREFGKVFRPGIEGYLGFNLYYFPLPSQTRLSTAFGTHEGYVLRQNFAGYFSEELGKSGWDLGGLWWIERHGWDSEDFLLFPNYSEFSLIRSVQTVGLSVANPKRAFGIAGGIQYQNPEFVGDIYAAESDSLYEWASAFVGPVSLQASFHHSDFRHARATFNLESKEIYGGRPDGIRTYLPNIDVALYDRDGGRDSLRISWEQNLFRQLLYAEAAVYFPDKALRYVALKYYPDPSKVVSFEATCYRKPNGTLIWGGGITMPFVRIAYSHAEDIENVFGLRGTVVLQLHFGIERVFEKFVGLNGSRSTPMMTREVDTDDSVKKERREEREREFQESRGTRLNNAAKELTATGIVREKAK